MRTGFWRMTRGMLVLLVMFMGVMGLTASPAAAQTVLCITRPLDQNLVRGFDNNADGTLTRAEILALADQVAASPDYTEEEKATLEAQFDTLIQRLNTAGVDGFRYDGQGPCAPATATSTTAPATATTAPATATTAPATSTTAPATATTAPGTATTVPATSTNAPATATTVPGTATTVPATSTTGPATATTVPGTATATTVPGTVTATVPATHPATKAATHPATTAPDDDNDDDAVSTVSALPDTGQGPDGGQGNATLVMLLGGMTLCIVGAFLWTQRRAS